ncbi:hypothetical protein BH10BDE1_BH10BDE1_09410 [soil metagenome]
MKRSEKLLMAFDCLKDQAVNVKSAVSTVRVIANKLGLSLRALTVVSPEQLLWPHDFTSEWLDEFQEIGREALGNFLRRNKIRDNVPSKVLLQPLSSKRENVEALLKEAKNSKAAMVAVFTHTEKNKAWRLPGRFINSLVSYSSLPILTVNVTAPALTSLKVLLIATDFSSEGARTFLKGIALAKQANAKIVLIHVWSMLATETLGASAGLAGGWFRVQDYLQKEEADLHKQGKRWIAKAKSEGVTAEFLMVSNPTSPVGAILRSATKHSANLIVMTEKTGPWASFFLGSVTRGIIGESKLPVLVFPARSKKGRK